MSENLFSVWRAHYDTGYFTCVLPDGCRDLIVKVVSNERPRWFVSPLFDRSESVFMEGSSTCVGFRLRPGVEIKEHELLHYIECKAIDIADVCDILDDFTRLDASVSEALACLSGELKSIRQVAGRLGVSARTLQRFIYRKTGRTPGYWFQLARVRKAAKGLSKAVNFAEVAEIYGFSDQSHMNREFQRWFKCAPSTVLRTPEFVAQLSDLGYG